MRNIFISVFAVSIILFAGSIELAKAQDSVKKTDVVKKPATVKAPAIDPATGNPPPIPINPKTGRPYTKYGYGYYATNKYDATKAGRTADSLKKAAALKTAVAAPPDKSLNAQYQYLLTKISNYQQPLVAAFWKNVIDSLNANRRNLIDARAKA